MIGVVAGVGPFAGLDLLHKILAQTIADKDQDHLPVASISQPEAIADRTAFLLGQIETNPAPGIVDQLLRLESIGATVAAIPCNTAHAPAIFEPVRRGLEAAGSQLKLLHMIAEVGRALAGGRPRIKQVGVLSTTGTAMARVYPLVLEPLGFHVLVVGQDIQEQAVQPAIYDPIFGIKARGGATEKARSHLLLGAEKLAESGAEALILGCTEIPIALPEAKVAGLPAIDPALILARALIAAYDPTRLVPAAV